MATVSDTGRCPFMLGRFRCGLVDDHDGLPHEVRLQWSRSTGEIAQPTGERWTAEEVDTPRPNG